MGIGDGLPGIISGNLDRILDQVGKTLTAIRTGGNVTFTGYLDLPQQDRDMASRSHDFDLVFRRAEPAGAPLQAGELVQDDSGTHYVIRAIRREIVIAVAQLWRCNSLGTVYRTTTAKNTVSGVKEATSAPLPDLIPCRITMHPDTGATQREGRPLQGEGRWMTQEQYSVVAQAGALQAGDELDAEGWPRLKIGRPAPTDGTETAWEVLATPVLPRGVAGREV